MIFEMKKVLLKATYALEVQDVREEVHKIQNLVL